MVNPKNPEVIAAAFKRLTRLKDTPPFKLGNLLPTMEEERQFCFYNGWMMCLHLLEKLVELDEAKEETDNEKNPGV